ncbi:uncharacterized protein YALI1_A08532g [Yarrowia lipolytica]|uniref:Uncharacterized protein n=1 Tax=Yarrowia lipolytica TaxID=4952 RepID=A0A1D8N440_YARLL|nr:hypothetical protein YALI1_A08532g [Yarrowia lipolytica]
MEDGSRGRWNRCSGRPMVGPLESSTATSFFKGKTKLIFSEKHILQSRCHHSNKWRPSLEHEKKGLMLNKPTFAIHQTLLSNRETRQESLSTLVKDSTEHAIR